MIWYDELREDVPVRTSARTAFSFHALRVLFCICPGLGFGRSIMAKVKVKVMVDIGEWSGFGGP